MIWKKVRYKKVKFVGWEQERPISTRRVRTSHLELVRKNVPSRVFRVLTLSRDGTILRAESRWDVLTRRAEMGCSYAPILAPTQRINSISVCTVLLSNLERGKERGRERDLISI